ncbi:MAG: RIP metalloprotease RseP [Pseudomonadota bacterium]
MIELLPPAGGLITTIVAFLVALGAIVAIHEYGHYIVGRWCGIQAEVFSLGFGPVLWSRVDRRGTRWQIAACPLGGYVKFMGDADAASGGAADDLAHMSPADRKRTMHGAALWARAATVAAGPVFNFILSILIFGGFVWWQGIAQGVPTIGSLKPLPWMEMENDLRPGDRVISVNDRGVGSVQELFEASARLEAGPVSYGIERENGERLTVQGPFPLPPIADAVQPRAAAIEAGLTEGDVITAVNGTPIFAFRELQAAVARSEGRPLALVVWRDGATREITLEPRRADVPAENGGFETRYLIGVSGGLFFEPRTTRPDPVSALWHGAEQVMSIIQSSLSGLAHVATGAISSCNLQGPIGIAETTGAVASQGIDNYIWFIAVLSTAIGLLNLLPIPVLDGGHLVFHAYEAVSGRPPSDRILRVFLTVGLALILLLMLFALANDLFCP